MAVLGLASLGILGSSCTSTPPAPEPPKDEALPHIGFPVLPPVAEADPSIRHPESVDRPTKLILRPEGDRIFAAWDEKSFETAQVDLGHKMILGYEEKIFLVRGQERVLYGRTLGSGGATVSASAGHLENVKGMADEDGVVKVEIDIVIFETNIPAQHFWRPRSGKYRILAQWTVKERTRLE